MADHSVPPQSFPLCDNVHTGRHGGPNLAAWRARTARSLSRSRTACWRSLVSLLTLVEGRLALEVGLVGREGMVGVALALGIGVSPVRALVQGSGTALRMNAARFRKELQRSAPLQRELYRYTHSLMAQITQTAACNRFHRVPARLARWLLMTRDRVRSGQFYLTHEFLAHMLGVRRVGVTEAASAL
ncbi:MAG: Crp/Fnr family transcriptional regulator, partial [Betaproteobacteria bacterium]